MKEYSTPTESVYACDLCQTRMIVPTGREPKEAGWMEVHLINGKDTILCPNCRESFREADQSQVNGYKDPEPVIDAARACHAGLQGAWQYLMTAIAEYDQ